MIGDRWGGPAATHRSVHWFPLYRWWTSTGDAIAGWVLPHLWLFRHGRMC